MSLPSNAMLERAHEISNRYRLDDEWHAKLIRLLEEVHDLGYHEGYNHGEEEGRAYHDEPDWA